MAFHTSEDETFATSNARTPKGGPPGDGIVHGQRITSPVRVEGDPAHLASHGKFCSKGSALEESVGPGGKPQAPAVTAEAAAGAAFGESLTGRAAC